MPEPGSDPAAPVPPTEPASAVPAPVERPIPKLGEPQTEGATIAKRMQEKKAELEKVAERRHAMLEADKAKKAQRAEEREKLEERQRGTYGEEVKAAEQRSEQKEEWRQDMHERKREEQKARWRAEEERKKEEIKKQKRLEEDKEKREYLDHLHLLAYRKKIKEQLANAQVELERELKTAEERRERERNAVDASERLKLASLDSDHKRQQSALHADDARKRQMLEERTKEKLREAAKDHAKADASAKRLAGPDMRDAMMRGRMDYGRLEMALKTQCKRELMGMDEQLIRKNQEIESVFGKLREEAKREAEAARQKVDRDCVRHKAELEERHQRTVDWITRGGGGSDTAGI